MNRDYEISNEKIIIKTAIPFVSLLEMEICHDINAHAILTLHVAAEKESQEEILRRDWFGTPIYVFRKENELLFAGSLEKIICRKENQMLMMEISGISETVKLDRYKKRQSFQNTELTYKEIVQKVIEGYAGTEVIWGIKEDKEIGKPIIQYDETDWEFLIRLSSHFREPLIAGTETIKPSFRFGMNDGKRQSDCGIEILGTGFNSIYYQNGSYDSGEPRSRAFYLEIAAEENWRMGDILFYDGRDYHVYGRRISFKKGELSFTYRLGMELVYCQKKIYNKALIGLRLEGVVKRTYEESVYLQLDIDKEEQDDYPWIWAPETNNLCYCMPEVHTKATLYLPTGEEKDGRVILSAIKNIQRNAYKDTQKREFFTNHQKRLGLYPDRIFLEGTKGKVSFSMSDQSGIRLKSNSDVVFQADGEISWAGKNITVTAPIEVVCRTPESNIELCRDINLYAPRGIKTVGTGDSAEKSKNPDVGEMETGKETEHWQISFAAISAVPAIDIGRITGADDIVEATVCGNIPKIVDGSAVIALSEVMDGKKESETSFPDAFKSMDNYTVKGGYALPIE